MLGTELAVREPMGADLRTVLNLLTGVRVSARVCRMWIDEVFEGRCEPRHEAIVYLLASHFLALGDRANLDNLAWRWLRARHPEQSWTVRLAADALRLAVFSAESGWDATQMNRLTTIIAQSRASPLWISLTDLARVGGRRADRLVDVVDAVDLTSTRHHTRRAAFFLLSGVHEIQHLSATVGDDYVLVSNRALDCRTATLFTDAPTVSPHAMAAISRARQRFGLLTALHSYDDGARILQRFDDDCVLVSINGPRRTYPEDHLSAVVHVHHSSPAANFPPGHGLCVQRVLAVFPSGSEVARSGRFWVVDRGRLLVDNPPSKAMGGQDRGSLSD